MFIDASIIAQFAFATLLPVMACAALTLIRQRFDATRIPEARWQLLVGIVFGLIAIYGTEAGIPVSGAMMNVRDAAPLAAGLFFGGPAGIIAGLIGGVERWFAVMWGVGSFTRVACSLGTIFAGIYAAALRKFLFDDHIPLWSMALVTGIVAEVVHLLLVFVTNFDQSLKAFEVVYACSLPMIGCVAASAALCAIVVAVIDKQPLWVPPEERNVTHIVQNHLLIGFVVAFLITIGFTSLLQTNLSNADTENLLQLNIADVEQNIIDASDANLLELTKRVASAIPDVDNATSEDCVRLASELDIAEIDVINEDGIIVASNIEEFVGFDMASGEQSAEFLVLLPGGGQKQLVQSYQPISFDNTTWRKYAGISIDGGLLQVGYDAEDFIDDLETHVEATVQNRHVGHNGELVVVDDAGRVITTHEASSVSGTTKLVADAKKMQPGEFFKTTYAGDEYYATYDVVESYRIIALLPIDEANASRDVTVLIMTLMEVLVFAALFLILYLVIKRVVVRSVWQVNGQLGEITRGNLETEVNVRNSAEFASLSDDINRTVGALKDSIAVVQADLDMAADIQANTLPAITSDISSYREFELFASMEPAKGVGGDFYDFFLLDNDHLALAVADVSGKGVPAALFMMQSKAVIKMETYADADPARALFQINADLSEKNNNDMFTTVWLGILEISTGKLTYADAGHEKLAILRDGIWELPKKPNGSVALAAFSPEDHNDLPENYRYRNHTIELKPGDAIFQYTDGVTEATDADNVLFGESRLLEALNDAPDVNPTKLLPHVRERIAAFVKDAPQFDDITMLGLLYTGNIESKTDTNGTE